MTRIWLACLLAGCWRAPPATPAGTAAQATATPPADAGVPRRRLAIARSQCAPFARAGAVGVAVVASAQPDCSSVGHVRIVLEVRRLARGSNIERVVTSRSLYDRAGRLAIGDVVIVAIDPAVQPAATVFCVPLPAHQGTVSHAVPVGSVAEAQPTLDAIADGSLCPPP